MPRPFKPAWDPRRKRWYTTAHGEVRTTKTGRTYRTRTYAPPEIGAKDQAKAWQWFNSLEEGAKTEWVAAGDLTFEQVSEFYLEWLDTTGAIEAETYDRRVEQLARFGEWPAADHPQRFDAMVARRITRAQVQDFARAMLDEGLSESYVADGLLKSVKACLSWAASVDPGKFPGLPLPENPLRGLKGPAKPRRKARPVEPGAVAAFLAWVRARAGKMPGLKGRFATIAATMLELIAATGCRPKDACVAEWCDWQVDPAGWGHITLPPWKWKNGAKTGQDRTIAVRPDVAAKIEAIRELPGRHPDRIFTRRRNRGAVEREEGSPEAGEPFVWLDHARKRKGDTKSLQKWFFRVVKAARADGVDLPDGFRLYWLRSGYATGAVRRGVNAHKLAQQMGTSVRMLERHYLDTDRSDALEAAMGAAGGSGGERPANPPVAGGIGEAVDDDRGASGGERRE